MEEPADFKTALAGVPAARARWRELSEIARRDFVRWIEGAKQTETRKRRIERACSMLEEGKSRPCCFAVVPLDLHNALKASPRAKARWSAMASGERRDLIDWIEAAKQKETRKRRIGQACDKLAASESRTRS